ncbi:S-adenosylmethionine decarboxylase proenzyme [compost metagenome]
MNKKDGVTNNSEHFGEHFTIDGYLCDRDMLDDRGNVLRAISELPALLGMKKLSGAEVYYAKGNDMKDPGGWSGFVVIEESHVSVHTFPDARFVSIDVYTCRNGLDRETIMKYFGTFFGIVEFETNFIVRGTRYPGLCKERVAELAAREGQ